MQLLKFIAYLYYHKIFKITIKSLKNQKLFIDKIRHLLFYIKRYSRTTYLMSINILWRIINTLTMIENIRYVPSLSSFFIIVTLYFIIFKILKIIYFTE